MSAQEGLDWGFFNALAPTGEVLTKATDTARKLASGPTFAHGMTKKCLHREWNVSIEQALDIEAEAQAICMQTEDFTRAYKAFIAKEKPVFKGN